MASQAKIRLLLLLWGVSAGPISFPADLAAQAASGQAHATLGAWIDAARASPFHDLMSTAAANPAAELAVDKGAGLPGMVRPPMIQPGSPQSTVSSGSVFAYASFAAFVPMVPAFIMSFSTSIEGLMWIFLGSATTLVTVPVAAIAAGAPSGPRAIVGSVTGLAAGSAFGMIVAGDWGDSWFAPVYSATMGLVTASIAVR